MKAELTIGSVTYTFKDEMQARTALEFFECFRYAFRVFGFAHAELWLRNADRHRVIEHVFVAPSDVRLTITGGEASGLEASQKTVDALVKRFEVKGRITVPDFEDIVLGIELESEHE